MNIFRRLSRILDNKNYKKNPVPQNLTEEQFSAINIGAINAEQTGYFCDSLSTGARATDIKENLSDYYDITDRESALDTLEWLLNSGHRRYFDLIKGIVSGQTAQGSTDELDQDDIARIEEYSSNLQESSDHLISCGFGRLKQPDDLFQQSVAAWDMGRLVLVTRCCFDVGYITDEEAWQYIFNARRISQETYTSWEDFACGYVIGRAMWSGYTLALNGIIGIAERLLKDDESPWKQSAF